MRMEGVPATAAGVEAEEVVPSIDTAMEAGIERRKSSGKRRLLAHEYSKGVN